MLRRLGYRVSMCVVMCVTGSVFAATATQEDLAADGANVNTSGLTVFAWNVNGDSDVDFKDVTWSKDQPASVVFNDYGANVAFSDAFGVAAAYTDADLGAIMEDYRSGLYNGGSSFSFYIDISGLTEGVEYEIQILTDFDRNWTQNQYWILQRTGGGASTSTVPNRQQLVTFEFTADADDAAGHVRLYGVTGNSRASISALLLQEALPNCQDDIIAQGLGLAADLNQDCYVEWADFGIFASQWQMCNDPQDPSCN